jgi:hypothetical protein
MSGTQIIPGGFEGRRHKHAATTPTSLLASLGERHRITKGGIKFNVLKPIKVKQFYKEVVGHVLNCKIVNLTAMEAASCVAMMFNINVTDIDRPE